MIQVASKYGPARPASKYGSARPVQASGPPGGGAKRIWVPTVTGARKRIGLRDWYWREIREGGFLAEYLRAEKGRTPAMLRTVARMMAGFQQNPRSDLRRLATIPARTYHRWKSEDEHFFEDDENLRSLKRDNPDACVYVGPKRVKGTRTIYGGRTTK